MVKRYQTKPAVRFDVHQVITDQIVGQLEKGVRPWARAWGTVQQPKLVRPLRHSGEPYRGINVLILWCKKEEKGYVSPYWMTFNQAKLLGGYVRKGETGTDIVFFTRRLIDEGTADERFVPIPRVYNVFNADQIEGLPAQFHPTPAEPIVVPKGPIARIPHADAFFESLGLKVKHGGNQAFYMPSQDRIQLPAFESFHSAEAYYGTRGHESVHATQIPTRLDRDFGRERWGDEGYAIEELVAELGAAFLGADLDLWVEPREDHASYLAHWLKVLKNDKRAIFTAASHAEKAVGFLHTLANPEMTVSADEIDSMAA